MDPSRVADRIDVATERRTVLERERAARMAAFRRAGSRENRCGECNKVMGEYLGAGTIYINRCPRCGAWNELTTMEPQAP